MRELQTDLYKMVGKLDLKMLEQASLSESQVEDLGFFVFSYTAFHKAFIKGGFFGGQHESWCDAVVNERRDSHPAGFAHDPQASVLTKDMQKTKDFIFRMTAYVKESNPS